MRTEATKGILEDGDEFPIPMRGNELLLALLGLGLTTLVPDPHEG